MSDYASEREGDGTSLADLLARTKAVGELDVRVRVLEDRLLRMQDVRLHLVDDDGRVVLRPEGIPLASLVAVPIFSDERAPTPGRGAAGRRCR